MWWMELTPSKIIYSLLLSDSDVETGVGHQPSVEACRSNDILSSAWKPHLSDQQLGWQPIYGPVTFILQRGNPTCLING